MCPRPSENFILGVPLRQNGYKKRQKILARPPLQILTVKNYFFLFLQILGGEKLLEKCRWNIFKRPDGGLIFSVTFRIVFRISFSRFSNRFRVKLFLFRGNSFCRLAALRKCFGANHFLKLTKESLSKAHSLSFFSCKKGHANGSNTTKEIFWWNYFCNNNKIITEEQVPRNYCNSSHTNRGLAWPSGPELGP